MRNPAAFLLDEPLSNLDANLRLQMRRELKQLHGDLKATMIYVTHDQVEAMALGDRIAVMNEGRVLQIGRPLDVYRRPANLFVAKFVGSVPMNFCQGTVTQTEQEVRFKFHGDDAEVVWETGSPGFETVKSSLGRGFAVDGVARDVVLGFRAHDVKVSDQSETFRARLTQVDRLGECTLLSASVCKDDNLESENQGCQILIRHDANSSLQIGDEVGLSVDLETVVWFDPETGKNLVKDN